MSTVERIEYTGQLLGGPDHGNMVTAYQPKIGVQQSTVYWLDGPHDVSTLLRPARVGSYVWNADDLAFWWRGWEDEMLPARVRRLEQENEQLRAYLRAADSRGVSGPRPSAGQYEPDSLTGPTGPPF